MELLKATMKKLNLFFIFVFSHSIMIAQNLELNIMAGPYLTATNGINNIDGVLIDARDNSNNEFMLALSANYNINKIVGLYFETGVFKGYSNLTVQDVEEACQFCPVEKRYLLSNTKLDVFLGPTLSVNLIPKVQTKFYVGPNMFINVKESNTSNSFNGLHLRTEEVMNALNNSQTSSFCVSYGLVISYNRFFLSAKYSRDIRLTKNINVFNSSYPLDTRMNILQLKLGYNFLRFIANGD